MPDVEIGGRTVTMQRFTLAKAMRVITLLGVIQKSVPEIQKAIAEFRREYGEANVIELDRVQAKMQFGAKPVADEQGDPLMIDGKLVTIPSPIDGMSEEDWQRANQMLRIRQAPSTPELVMAVFPLIYEHAEQPVMRLLALVAMSNEDVGRYVRDGEIWERVDTLAQDLIAPALLEEVMELAVAAAETVEGQVMTKAKTLGGRMGNLMRLLGLKPQTETTEDGAPQPNTVTLKEQPEQPSTESASDSLDSSSGTPSESSLSLGTPSSPSVSSSLASAS